MTTIFISLALTAAVLLAARAVAHAIARDGTGETSSRQGELRYVRIRPTREVRGSRLDQDSERF
jgi:hypothetical protein